MKKAFTLSETLISLAIIGVLAAVLIPVINNVRPDKDRILYKKAMYTLQNALSTAIDDNSGESGNSASFWADDKVSSTRFCEDIAQSLNIVGNYQCGIPGSFDNPNFVTVNGAKWWGLGNYKFNKAANATKDVYVDVNGNKGDNTDGYDQLKMRVRYDGRVTTDPTWTTENDYLSDALKIHK